MLYFAVFEFVVLHSSVYVFFLSITLTDVLILFVVLLLSFFCFFLFSFFWFLYELQYYYFISFYCFFYLFLLYFYVRYVFCHLMFVFCFPFLICYFLLWKLRFDIILHDFYFHFHFTYLEASIKFKIKRFYNKVPVFINNITILFKKNWMLLKSMTKLLIKLKRPNQ